MMDRHPGADVATTAELEEGLIQAREKVQFGFAA